MGLVKYFIAKYDNKAKAHSNWRMTPPNVWEGVSMIYSWSSKVDYCPSCGHKLKDSEGINSDFKAFNNSFRKGLETWQGTLKKAKF